MKSNAVKWLIKNSKGQRANIFWLILANAFFAILAVAFAYAVKVVIDGAVNKDRNMLLWGAVAIFLVILLQFAFRLIIHGLTEHIKGKLEINYKSAIFAQILNKRYSEISTYHSGELMNRLTADVSVIADGVSTIIPTVVSSVVRLISAIVVLCFIDWVFAVAFVVAGLLVFAVIALLRKKLKSLHKKTQETDGKTRSFMQECIENVLAIKVFAVTDKTERISDELQQENFKIKMKRRNYNILGNSTYNFIFSAGYIFALIFGGIKIFNGVAGFGYGDLSAILQLVNSVQVPFASLSNVLPKLYATTASAERLIEIENLQEDGCDKTVNPEELYPTVKSLCAKDLTFTYGDRDVVYNKASLLINKGESIAITGVSGVGKSTIMKLLLGVYPVEEGELYFDCEGQKVPVSEYTRSLFAYVPQGNMLFSGTIKDNVTFINGKATDQEIDWALKISCANEFVDSLPEKLMTQVGENGLGLSEGQVQRIAIARAVLSGAPILLLDEATGSLDEKTEKKVIENLLNIKNKTVILVSHRLSAAKMCGRIVNVDGKKFN